MDSILGHEELGEIINSITESISREILLANRTGNLEQVLSKYNHLIQKKEENAQIIISPNKAKILILGFSQVSKNDIFLTFKHYGIPSTSIDIIDEESKISQFNIDSLLYSQTYTDLFIGPIKHSMKGKGGYESIIEYVKANRNAFPTLAVLMVNGELKITKTSIKTAIENSTILQVFK
jgi:hypothetical protein